MLKDDIEFLPAGYKLTGYFGLWVKTPFWSYIRWLRTNKEPQKERLYGGSSRQEDKYNKNTSKQQGKETPSRNQAEVVIACVVLRGTPLVSVSAAV